MTTMASSIILQPNTPIVYASDMKMLAAYAANSEVELMVIADVENQTQIKNLQRLVHETRIGMNLPKVQILFLCSYHVAPPDGYVHIKLRQP